MYAEQCHKCGYELTGLASRGTCPECGEGYDTQSQYRTTQGSQHFISRHAAPIGLGMVAVLILICGGALSLVASNSVSLILVTLAVAGLPAFGAFVYWWSDRVDRRDDG